MYNKKNFNNKLILPVIIIIGGISLLQYHSIQFWGEYTGKEIGWAWSLLLEMICLWLASLHKKHTTTLAIIASILLLASPLYWVGSEAINKAQTRISNTQQQEEIKKNKGYALKENISLMKSLIQEDKAQIRQYLKNSDTRAKWSPLITQAKTDLSKHTEELINLLNESTRRGYKKEDINERGAIFGIFLQCLVLILIQITDVIAIRYIAIQLTKPEPIKPKDAINNLNCTIASLRLKDKLREEQVPSYQDFCNMISISRRQLGLLMNTKDEKKNPDQPFPTRDTYEKVIEYIKGVQS